MTFEIRPEMRLPHDGIVRKEDLVNSDGRVDCERLDGQYLAAYDLFRISAVYALSEQLASELSFGYEHARVLVQRFNWRLHIQESGKQHLLPPQEAETFFLHQYARVLDGLKSGQLKPHDVVLPAFTYVKTERGQEHYYFQSPGIDLEPLDGFTLLTSRKVMSYRVWAAAIAAGRRPINAVSGLLYHEYAHQTEEGEDFKYMTAVRRVYREHDLLFALEEEGALSHNDRRNFIRAKNLMRIFAEAVTVVDQNQSAYIELLTPDELKQGAIDSLRGLMQRFKGEDGRERLSRDALNVVRFGERCLLRSGGALRDGFHIQQYLREQNYLDLSVQNLTWPLSNMYFKVGSSFSPIHIGIACSLTELWEEIRMIHREIELREEFSSRGLKESLQIYDQDELMEVLGDRISRFQMGIWGCFSRGLTRADLIRRAGSLDPNDMAPIREWLELFHDQDSALLEYL